MSLWIQNVFTSLSRFSRRRRSDGHWTGISNPQYHSLHPVGPWHILIPHLPACQSFPLFHRTSSAVFLAGSLLATNCLVSRDTSVHLLFKPSTPTALGRRLARNTLHSISACCCVDRSECRGRKSSGMRYPSGGHGRVNAPPLGTLPQCALRVKFLMLLVCSPLYLCQYSTLHGRGRPIPKLKISLGSTFLPLTCTSACSTRTTCLVLISSANAADFSLPLSMA
ncbi:hypothetical protein R3P38DRAFT_1836331 [Favolaschia claudopus]|uniref:Uncharacterized protein n=1 Tax=Favolaschia claudopus TaxID=2862362 RepID=A0AAW0A303_9AGAR